jgi:hypothetical protein
LKIIKICKFNYCCQREKKEGNISEVAFCEMLLAYAGFNSSKTKQMLKKISKQYGSNSKVCLIFYKNI